MIVSAIASVECFSEGELVECVDLHVCFDKERCVIKVGCCLAG